MLEVCVKNSSGAELLFQASVRKDVDRDVLEVAILPTSEFKWHPRDEFLFNDPAPSKSEFD